MTKRTINISGKDGRAGIVDVKIQAKLTMSGTSPAESKKLTEQFRDELFKLLNEYFYVSEIKK